MHKKVALVAMFFLLAVTLGITMGGQQGLARSQMEELIEHYQSLVDAGKYQEAEVPAKGLLAFGERVFPNHIFTASFLSNLAVLYRMQGRYEEAIPLLQRAFSIREKFLVPNHPDAARFLDYLALLRYQQGDLAKSESLHMRALAIHEANSGSNRHLTAVTLMSLGLLHKARGRRGRAESFYSRAVAIDESLSNRSNANAIALLTILTGIYHAQGEDDSTIESLMNRALTIHEKALSLNLTYDADAPGDLIGRPLSSIR